MIEEFSFLGFPLCSREVRKIAYDFAQANGFEGFSKDSSEAGWKWFAFLLKCDPKLKVKEGVTNLSIARAKASDHDLVTRWYKKYQNVLDQLEITDPKYIWNIDEHGSEDMPKVKKVIGLKGINLMRNQREPWCWPMSMLQALHCLPWWSTMANTMTLGEHIAPELSWSEAPRKDTSTNFCLQNMESGLFTIYMLLGNWTNQTWSWWTVTTHISSTTVIWR